MSLCTRQCSSAELKAWWKQFETDEIRIKKKGQKLWKRLMVKVTYQCLLRKWRKRFSGCIVFVDCKFRFCFICGISNAQYYITHALGWSFGAYLLAWGCNLDDENDNEVISGQYLGSTFVRGGKLRTPLQGSPYTDRVSSGTFCFHPETNHNDAFSFCFKLLWFIMV